MAAKTRARENPIKSGSPGMMPWRGFGLGRRLSYHSYMTTGPKGPAQPSPENPTYWGGTAGINGYDRTGNPPAPLKPFVRFPDSSRWVGR